jgi:hypothetical protein
MTGAPARALPTRSGGRGRLERGWPPERPINCHALLWPSPRAPVVRPWSVVPARKRADITAARSILTKLRLCNDAIIRLRDLLHFLKFVIGK